MRQVSTDVVSGNMKSKALDIIKEHFVHNTEIQRELELYQLLLTHKFNSESKASTLVEATVTARVRLDSKKLRHAKYKIIKEIRDAYTINEFFSGNVPNYIQYASVYKLFENGVSNEVTDPVDISKCKHALLEHICGKTIDDIASKSTVLLEFEKQPEDIRLLTTKILVDRFNEKYEQLSSKQKSLLREYINNSRGSLKKFVESELPKIKKELTELSPIVTDVVVKIKLNEVIKQLECVTKGRDIKDSHVQALLGYYTLLDELRRTKNEQK
jgi:hypothetical protein